MTEANRPVARHRGVGSSEVQRPGLLRFCPFCGHVLYDDMTAEKRFGVQTMFCPPERLRIVYCEFSASLVWEKLNG